MILSAKAFFNRKYWGIEVDDEIVELEGDIKCWE
jgi:hypothetical protein